MSMKRTKWKKGRIISKRDVLFFHTIDVFGVNCRSSIADIVSNIEKENSLVSPNVSIPGGPAPLNKINIRKINKQ